jgi:Putative  PD-(D/E)XK family member, (DUF4420)
MIFDIGDEGQDARFMSWENFRTQFLDEGLAVDVPVVGEPPVTVFAEPNGNAIGLRIPIPNGTKAPTSSVEAIQVGVADGSLRVRTSDPELFQPFFAFVLDISNRVQLDAQSPVTAFNSALASWRRMLAASSVMSDELQVGLAGELWTLRRLVTTMGGEAVEAWTGPDREAHDFRLEDVEIEVKTTAGENRRHIISRLDQLLPSPGMKLYIISLMVTSAGIGPGWTLADQVSDLRALVSGSPDFASLLEQKLSASGWRDVDAPRYPRRRRLAGPAVLVAVDDACPRIIQKSLDIALGPLAHRVDDVRYRVNLDGLGVPDGDPRFTEVLPEVRTDP